MKALVTLYRSAQGTPKLHRKRVFGFGPLNMMRPAYLPRGTADQYQTPLRARTVFCMSASMGGCSFLQRVFGGGAAATVFQTAVAALPGLGLADARDLAPAQDVRPAQLLPMGNAADCCTGGAVPEVPDQKMKRPVPRGQVLR